MREGKELTDKELLMAAREGKEEAFRQLFEKYWDDLYRIAYKRLHSREDVRDILQDLFLSLWNNIDRIDVDESLGGYLYTALRHKIFNFYDKQYVRLNALLRLPFNAVQSAEDTWSMLRVKELQAFVAEEISRMPPRMKQIILLSQEEQLTISEISMLLVLAPQTVKSQLHRALVRIRQGLISRNLVTAGIFIMDYQMFFFKSSGTS